MTSKIVTGKPSLLKQMNRNIIIKLVFQYGSISRAQIAKLTNLKLPSVMRLVDGLIEDGIIVDIGKGDSSGGRRPNLISLKQDAMYIIGVEIAIKTTIILTDLVGHVIDKWQSEELLESTPEYILSQVHDKINGLLDTHYLEPNQIAGIGIGTPGTNFKYVKEIEYSILRGWESIDVKRWFEEKTKIRVFVDNVARTRTLAELWFGHGKMISDFIYVFIDQGVGCGIVHNNKIFEGHHKVAGEFGHTIISLDGKSCYCGSQGCLEMYVSAGAITHDIKLECPEVMNFSEAIQNAPESNVLTEAGRILGIGISNLINIHNPKSIILGGIVPMSSEIFTESVIQSVEANIFSRYAEKTPVLLGSVEQDGIGSIALVINHIFESEI